MKNKITFFWFRRDLRLEDNVALHYALKASNNVQALFIFDDTILNKLPKDDARVSFIYNSLNSINDQLNRVGASLLIKKGNPKSIWNELTVNYNIDAVYANKDYEPYAIKRDFAVEALLNSKNISFRTFKDQVIFEESEVLKKDGLPYTVYTPYKNKWLLCFDKKIHTADYNIDFKNFSNEKFNFPSLSSIGFLKSSIKVIPYRFDYIKDYDIVRDFPSDDKTSYLSPYLRFGLVSIRKMVLYALKTNETFLSELIWREFFMQVLYHFPRVVDNNFKVKYDLIQWRNNEEEFNKWCIGETGYPLVDAGMRQLNKTGYMHNRVRMITAGFLCKHLLIDWRWGEAYFASKLLDYDLSANNGNWQWAAGTGCDAAPYFRVFNPIIQLKKFDKNLSYVKKWITDFNELTYPMPIVDHKLARERAINTYKSGLNKFV